MFFGCSCGFCSCSCGGGVDGGVGGVRDRDRVCNRDLGGGGGGGKFAISACSFIDRFEFEDLEGYLEGDFEGYLEGDL